MHKHYWVCTDIPGDYSCECGHTAYYARELKELIIDICECHTVSPV